MWRGSVSVRVDGKRRRASVMVLWGPGTPFFPPRVFPIEKQSKIHQLRDGDMCLLTPGDTDHGYEGVLDIEFWCGRAEDWLVRYFREGWSTNLPPILWVIGALHRPGYRYRVALTGTLIVGLPDAWATLGAGWGTATLLIPREGVGLGVVQEWDHLGKTYRWEEGVHLVREPVTCHGVWIAGSGAPIGDAAGLHAMIEAGAALADSPWGQGERRFMLVGAQEGEGLGWTIMVKRQPEFNPYADPITGIRSLTGNDGIVPGIVLSAESLDARRKQGRDAVVFDKIATTRFVVVGLGSLGSEIVHLLAKEGARNFVLVDGDVMLPGNEARHRAGIDTVGHTKTNAVAKLVHAIVPSAQVETIEGYVDDLAPSFVASFDSPVVVLGATGDEAAEYLLSDLAQAWRAPVLHAWLERDGRVLRVVRTIPGRDPRLVDLASRLDVPKADRLPVSQAAVCAELVLPGSALDIHAAANFTVRRALSLAIDDAGDDNHWLFTACGLAEAPESDPLRYPYSTVARAFPND